MELFDIRLGSPREFEGIIPSSDREWTCAGEWIGQSLNPELNISGLTVQFNLLCLIRLSI